jgi:hypothetical protein
VTTTAAVAVAPHTLIRREGARTGSFHAALLVQDEVPAEHGLRRKPRTPAVWRTACGEDLQDSHRGWIHAYTLEEAAALLALDAQPVAVCRRCERVGDSLGA